MAIDATLDAGNISFRYNNSTTSRKLLKLMQADGLEEIETADCSIFQACNADGGDYYKPGNILSDLTIPPSKNYIGQTTGVTVSDINGDIINDGMPITATFSIPASVTTATITVTTTPYQLELIIDGDKYSSPATFKWITGSSHSIASYPYSGQVQYYTFLSWSDNGAQLHTITTPSSDTTYTAIFEATKFLNVTPADGLTASGSLGGPFTPTSIQYTIKNTGSSTLTWIANKGQSWVNLSSTGGTLVAGESATVTVSITSGASNYSSGNYIDSVSFTSSTGNTESRQITLNVSSGITVTTSCGGGGGGCSVVLGEKKKINLLSAIGPYGILFLIFIWLKLIKLRNRRQNTKQLVHMPDSH